jgi:predicted branched-subunit amino acid permease
MEYLNQLNNIIPPSLGFLLGAIGCICFLVLVIKKTKSKKSVAALTTGYCIGAIGFIPFMISVIAG